jgi:hypothetical protein
MSGSTSFGKKGNAAIDPTAKADVSPSSESDEIQKSSKPGGSQKKAKKLANTKAKAAREAEKAKTKDSSSSKKN